MGSTLCLLTGPFVFSNLPAIQLAKKITEGPAFGNMMTKTMLSQEWSMTIDQAFESEARAAR